MAPPSGSISVLRWWHLVSTVVGGTFAPLRSAEKKATSEKEARAACEKRGQGSKKADSPVKYNDAENHQKVFLCSQAIMSWQVA